MRASSSLKIHGEINYFEFQINNGKLLNSRSEFRSLAAIKWDLIFSNEENQPIELPQFVTKKQEILTVSLKGNFVHIWAHGVHLESHNISRVSCVIFLLFISHFNFHSIAHVGKFHQQTLALFMRWDAFIWWKEMNLSEIFALSIKFHELGELSTKSYT